jgi:glycogen(starch) synthase
MAQIEKLARIRQQVAELKRTFAADLIHINAVSRSDFFHHLTFQTYPAPMLVTLHGGWLPEADEIVRRTLLSANWVVGCSEATLDKGRKLVPEIRSRSSVIHNALPEPLLPPAPLSFYPPRLLCLGRLVEDKGFDLALIALSSLVDRFPQIRLIIAGEGPARTDLQRQAAKLGILNVVQFTGPVKSETVPRLVNTVTVVVMPSRWEEPFGLVALEAALMARPIVATRVGGVSEVVVHEQTGFLVEKENSQALAASIVFLLEHPTTTMQMGQAGRIRALEHFSWDQYVDAYDALYRRLIAQEQTEIVLPAGIP